MRGRLPGSFDQLSPASFDAHTSPIVVPTYTPAGSCASHDIASRRTLTNCGSPSLGRPLLGALQLSPPLVERYTRSLPSLKNRCSSDCSGQMKISPFLLMTMGKPKLPGRPFSIGCHESPASVLRSTPPWNCRYSVFESRGSSTGLCGQQHIGEPSVPVGICGKPLLHGRHDSPPSVVRNMPTALTATHMRFGFFASTRIVCRHNPPLPGNQSFTSGPLVSALNSFHVSPRSREMNSPASSTPQSIVFLSFGTLTICQIRFTFRPPSS